MLLPKMTLGFNTFKKWIMNGKPPKSNCSNAETSKRGKNSAAANVIFLHIDEETFSVKTNSDDWLIDDSVLKCVSNNHHNFGDLKRN